jgi:hypothetical protein
MSLNDPMTRTPVSSKSPGSSIGTRGIRMSLLRFNKGSFKRFAQQLPNDANWIVSVIAERFTAYVREEFLSGQVLRERSISERAMATKSGRQVRTRSTKESTRFYKLKKGYFVIRPGSGIVGRLNYLAGKRFEGGERPFIRPAWRRFAQRREHLKIAEELMKRVLERENRKARGVEA